MAEAITNELLYEVLKKIQADVAHIRGRVDDHDQQFIAMRDQLHAIQGDMLRADRQAAGVGHRLERPARLCEAQRKT